MAPYYLAVVNRSRGKRHGDQPWQEDHWKAGDAKRGARKHNHSSIPVPNFSVGDRVDRDILQVLGLLHNGRHLLQRILSSKESLREHHHDEK